MIAITSSLFAKSQTDFIQGVVNTYHSVVEIIPSKACLRVTNVAALDVNSRVMIVQMRGASILTANNNTFGDTTSLNGAGNYEIGTICYIIGDSVFLFHDLFNTYNTSSGKVQLVQFGEYYSAEVTDTIKAAPWDSTAGTGGVIAIFTDQELILNKPIYADSSGYRGGSFLQHSNNCIGGATGYVYNGSNTSGFTTGGAYKGDGVSNLTAAQTGGRGAPANGGGGGNNHNNSGGGGANLNTGGRGGGNSSSTGCTVTARGEAGKALSNWSGTKIFMGGGGGAGHNNHGIFTLGGGNGGGIIFIWSNNIVGNNQLITACGGAGGQSQSDGAGGGGAGGTIILHVNSYTGNAIIKADGGNGGNSNDAGNTNYCYGGGGGGSGGVIYFTGTTPAITRTMTGGLAGVESGRDPGCAAEQAALAGTDGQYFSNYTFIRSTSPAGYCKQLLPVDLLFFSAQLMDNKVTLHWEVGEPALIKNYGIERSENGITWHELKLIPGVATISSYTTLDEMPPNGVVFYRVRFTEKNEKTSYSPVRKINNSGKAGLLVYPNPAHDKIFITSSIQTPILVQLYNVTGIELMRVNISQFPATIHLPTLQAGVYILRAGHSFQKLIIR